MQIRLLGELSFKEMRQALFEALNEIEDEFAIRYSRGAVLFLTPTDGCDETVVARNSRGRVITRVTKKGPYRSAADEYCP